MRRFLLTGVLAALGAALLASPAIAFDHHFNVIARQVSGHEAGHNGFRFKDKLFQPHNRDNRIGRLRALCKQAPGPDNHKCKATVHLNGKVGGFGDIRVKGNVGRDDNRVNVVGGTGQFDGVAGKMLIHQTSGKAERLHFDLTR